MVNERDKLTRHVLDVAYTALTKGTPYGQYLTLVGAHSIYKQLNALFKGFNEDSRTTEDLDFNLYNISLTEEDYILFQRALSSALGNDYVFDFYSIKTRQNSITYSFRVSYRGIQTRKLKIDFSLTSGKRLYDCQPLPVSLAKKLCLSAKLVDRRAKDKIDVVMLMKYLYSKGISKSDLLTLISASGNTLEVDERWFTAEGYDLVKRSFKGFRGCSEEFISASIFFVRILVTGLVRSEVPLYATFHEGKWLW